MLTVLVTLLASQVSCNPLRRAEKIPCSQPNGYTVDPTKILKSDVPSELRCLCVDGTVDCQVAPEPPKESEDTGRFFTPEPGRANTISADMWISTPSTRNADYDDIEDDETETEPTTEALMTTTPTPKPSTTTFKPTTSSRVRPIIRNSNNYPMSSTPRTTTTTTTTTPKPTTTRKPILNVQPKVKSIETTQATVEPANKKHSSQAQDFLVHLTPDRYEKFLRLLDKDLDNLQNSIDEKPKVSEVTSDDILTQNWQIRHLSTFDSLFIFSILLNIILIYSAIRRKFKSKKVTQTPTRTMRTRFDLDV